MALGFAGSPLPAGVRESLDISGTLAEATARAVKNLESAKIPQALKEAKGDLGLAAQKLGISVKNLNEKLSELGIVSSRIAHGES